MIIRQVCFWELELYWKRGSNVLCNLLVGFTLEFTPSKKQTNKQTKIRQQQQQLHHIVTIFLWCHLQFC